MDTYRIEWKSSARKELRKIDRKFIPQIIQTVESLAEEPFPSGVRKLQGGEHSYRIRIADYRIIYQVFETTLIVEIIRVRHRREAYR